MTALVAAPGDTNPSDATVCPGYIIAVIAVSSDYTTRLWTELLTLKLESAHAYLPLWIIAAIITSPPLVYRFPPQVTASFHFVDQNKLPYVLRLGGWKRSVARDAGLRLINLPPGCHYSNDASPNSSPFIRSIKLTCCFATFQFQFHSLVLVLY